MNFDETQKAAKLISTLLNYSIDKSARIKAEAGDTSGLLNVEIDAFEWLNQATIQYPNLSILLSIQDILIRNWK